MRLKNIIFPLVLIVLLSGCGIEKNKQLAEQTVDQLYQTLATENISAALNFYSEEFYKVTSREQWLEMLSKIKQKLGNYQSHKLIGWRVFTGSGPAGMRSYITLTYKVKYSKHEATETIVLMNRKGSLKIISHNINSPGLLLE